jgi:virginiamycin B lyase
MSRPLLPVLACALLSVAFHAEAQDFPEGPGKQIVTAVCGACHDINRIRVGYTPDGWRTVIRMMQNVDTPVPADQWATVTEYLTKNFPERSRPAAVVLPGSADAVIKEWPVPTPGSRPHDPLATKDGVIWWTGQLANTLGRLDPSTGQTKEYVLKTTAHGTAWPHRRQGWQYLVHGQQRRADWQA